jgi:transcriptional regulator with XRE-family HTH domain
MRNKVRQIREKQGISQTLLSRLAEVTQSNLYEIETFRRKPWPKARRQIATALHCTETEVFPEG